MRHQGKITSWKDEQGYGFITPNGGGPQVFVHIKSLAPHVRRPKGGDIVTYELTVNGKGQARAANVSFVRPGVQARRASPTLLAAAGFLALLVAAVLADALPPLLLAYYAGASAISFAAYAWDKSAARKQQWRTRESTLHLFDLAGGWPGALVAQHLLRHKSRKTSFQAGFWITAALNCAALCWLLTPAGSRFLQALTAY